AEAKAAEAARLRDRAASHRDEAASSREQLDSKWEHADSLDPRRTDDVDDAYAAAEKDRVKMDGTSTDDGLQGERVEQVEHVERSERDRDPQHRVVN
ncbi:MAG: hypothetical protein M3O32_11665, partial [Actinomycetota bacterium]|nr:hypothetical protein [Actinomycetota bacterium]